MNVSGLVCVGCKGCCCRKHVALRPRKRDGLLGTGKGGGGGGGERVSGSSAQSDPQKTEEAVDHRQNNSYVKAVGSSSVRSNYCTPLFAVSTALRSRVTKTMSVAQLWGEHLKQKTVQLSEPSSTSLLLISSGLS